MNLPKTALLFVLLGFCQPVLSGAIPAAERQALIDLYNSTNGAGWTTKTNWLGAAGTENTWSGVTTDAGNTNVLYLYLQQNNLSGPLPASLGSLSKLQDFVLYGNKLTGAFPASLLGISTLGRIDLHANLLTGGLPSTLGDLMPQMVMLNLSINQFTGSIPSNFGGLTNLMQLSLYSNQLTGSIPTGLGNLSKLQQLYLNNNQLTGTIPSSLGNLANLQYLYLYSNQLSGSIPTSFGNLTKMFYLYLASNQFGGPIPAELGNLVNLSGLSLNGNRLTGSIPASFANLINLSSAATNIGYNALYTTNATLLAFLNSKDPDWASTQTIAPTNVSAAAGGGAVTVSWTPITYIANTGGYRVLYGTSSSGPYTFYAQTANKSVTTQMVGGLPPGTYYFVIHTRTDSNVNNFNTLDSEGSVLAQVTLAAATTLLIPFGSLDNGNVNIGNIGSVSSNIAVKVLDANGNTLVQQPSAISANGVRRTWDLIDNVYLYGKPVTMVIDGDQALVGDNIKWAGPPYETVGAGFTCAPVSLMKGKEFFLPFNSSVNASESANGYCVIANATALPAAVTVEVYDQNGVLKKTAPFSVPGNGVVRSWDYVGSIQALADPALLRITSSQDVVVEAVRWVQNRRGWGFAIFPATAGSGTSFLVPFGSLDNGNVNLANISSATANVTLGVLSAAGVSQGSLNFTIPAKGVRRTWDLIGNIYNYGKPVSVTVASDRPLVGDNIKWAGPPYDTVGAGFTCGPLTQMKGKSFAFPFNSSVNASEWANGYCVISNSTTTTANVTVTVYDQTGILKKTASFTVPGLGVVRSWDYVGSIQSLADPALLKITSDQDVVVESVRWVQNKLGWGFAILPIY